MTVSGYVLAGGKSSRMGRDKALLELNGRPLIELAVEKLKAVCAEVHILGNRPELAAYTPLVTDVHPGCGPLGGMEAALLHSQAPWSLFLPVDMPFVPMELIRGWIEAVTGDESARISIFVVNGQPQPALCLVHRELRPFVERAVADGAYKVLPLLKAVACEMGEHLGVPPERVLVQQVLVEEAASAWFANLNTPEEFSAVSLGAEVFQS